MRRLILSLISTIMALQSWGQDSFKFLVRGEGENIKAAVDAAAGAALEPCKTLLPDSVNVDFSKAITDRKTIRSGFSGGSAYSSVLVTFSTEKVSALMEEKGVSTKGLGKKILWLQRDNTARAFESLFTELEALAPTIMDGKVAFTSDDGFTKSANALITLHTNANTARFCSILDATVTALSITEDEQYAIASGGFMTYNVAYFLNIPEYNIKEGTATIKRNIRHYSKDPMNGFTYEDDYHRELYFLAPLDINRLKRIFLVAVNSYKIMDDKGRRYITNLCQDFMDVLYVDDFAKAITNIDFWNVPIQTKAAFEDKWGARAFELGGHVAFFLMPSDSTVSTICQVRYSPGTYTEYSLEPPYSAH
ncbi:MAG: hypothetical protein IJK44_08435 [Bacteroidales bacterium]|nr:hypothetical protein [Bacteroidales bacterium]